MCKVYFGLFAKYFIILLTFSIKCLFPDDGAAMMEIDHELKQVFYEQMKVPSDDLGVLIPTEDALSQRLTTPIVTTYVDTDKISFERYFADYASFCEF